MSVPNRYNGGGPLSGVVLVDASTGDPYTAGSGATGPGSSAAATRVTPASYTQLGYQQITAATLAASTAMTVPGGATTAIVQNNTTQPARFRPDGATTAPTATTGQRLISGGTLTLDIGNTGLGTTRFILEAAGTGNFDITYYS